MSLCIILAISFHLSTLPRHFNHIVESQTLRIGYFKSPDVAYRVAGENFGYEYQILKRFADQHKLSIELVPITPETVNYALNLSKIDIAIGGFIESVVDERLFQKSQPFESQSLIAVERRKKNVNASDTINFPVYFGQRFANLASLSDVNFSVSQTETDELSLFESLSKGEIELVATTLARLRILQRFFPDIRRVKKINDLSVNVVWLFGKRASPSFINKINQFIEDKKTTRYIKKLQTSAYKQPKNIHYLDTLGLNKHIKTRLPEFERWFKQAAKEYDFDWITLAAMAYQESKWSVDAVSPTKVRGIMQMTTATATALGIENRLDPYSTIFGAAKYVKSLEKRVPKRVTGEDRTLMAIGAYNIGFGNILKAYRQARKGNVRAITWSDMEIQLPRLRINSLAEPIEIPPYALTDENQTFARGKQAVDYVARIKEFSEILRYHAAD